MQELVKMSPKGQLVVPQGIRKEEQFKSGDRFVAVAVKDGVLFKRIEIPNVKAEFQNLVKQIEKKFRKRKISKKDIKDAVRWARKR